MVSIMTNIKAKTLEDVVTFKNSQGEHVQGSLLKIEKTSIILEIYNPYSIVQLSEVLSDLKVRKGQEDIYSGRAVVSNLVNTGLMLLVSATLVDNWSDLNKKIKKAKSIKTEVNNFVDEWQNKKIIKKNYLLAVTELRNFLNSLFRWLEQIEYDDKSLKESHNEQKESYFSELIKPIYPVLDELFIEFEKVASTISPEELSAHKGFAQRDLHPFFLRAPFFHRAYHKPLGYAGDYEMVNMMLRDGLEGSSAYASFINAYYVNQVPAQAHRNRIDLLLKRLNEEITRKSSNNKNISILNIGCGPAIEIQQALNKEIINNYCDIELVDFNEHTLKYTESQIKKISINKQNSSKINFIKKSVHEILRGNEINQGKRYDFIYCAGLFDYLSDKVCSRLLTYFHTLCHEDGSVLVTNVHSDNPIKYTIEHLMEWYLIYRNEDEMKELVPPHFQPIVYVDATKINIFLEFKKNGR